MKIIFFVFLQSPAGAAESLTSVMPSSSASSKVAAAASATAPVQRLIQSPIRTPGKFTFHQVHGGPLK